ncbi:MAG: primosomal protein N', partial [Microbacterium sp.]
SAIIAVPDHRDLDRLAAALDGRVPSEAVVRHDAGQSGPERYGGYLRTLDERPCVVIGNRSAVYAPVHAPGLIAVWDDGDTLHEEPLAPYAHTRDAMLVRQGIEPCALLFAGHTRTTDVQRLVEIGFVAQVDQARRERPNVVLSASREDERGARIPSAAFRAAREALGSGPVLVQVARPGYAPSLVCADCRAPARCATCGGPLRARARGAVPVCGWCGRGAHTWACPQCASTRFRLSSSGSERTADELGRAFAGTRVILSDGSHPVLDVGPEPALVVATRGAEPVADGGYAAVLLLDGERMLQSPQLRIGESCLRWWSNAASLAAPGAPVHLADVSGAVARALASWTQAGYARQELAERAPLRLPPAARVARLEGSDASVGRALERLREAVPELPPDAILGPVPLEDGDRFGPSAERALVRFEYGRGPAVTSALRAAVVAEAVSTRRRRDRRARTRTTLAVRVDVLEPEL